MTSKVISPAGMEHYKAFHSARAQRAVAIQALLDEQEDADLRLFGALAGTEDVDLSVENITLDDEYMEPFGVVLLQRVPMGAHRQSSAAT